MGMTRRSLLTTLSQLALAAATGTTQLGDTLAGPSRESLPIAIEPVLSTQAANGKPAPVPSGAAAKVLDRYQALLLARQKLNDDGPIGSLRSADAGQTRVHTEILRIRTPALPELELYHGLSIDTYGVESDRPERITDGGIFTTVNGREHFLLPHFTGQNPDSSTAVHDDFMLCPFGTRLPEMESCPRLAARFRATLAQSKDPVRTLRELLALGLILDLHLSRLGGFHTPRPIRRLEELEPSGQIRLSADVLARLPKLPRKPPYILPLPLAEKHNDSYLATAYVALGSEAWFVELRISPQSLYFARSRIGAVPTYGP